MAQTEMKSRLMERSKALEGRFEKMFDKRIIKERTCFACHNGMLFALDYIPPYGALVLEYADNVEEAKMNRFEDGDLFFLEEMDEETMFQSMIQEIKQ